MTRRDIYRPAPDGEPDYDGYDEIPDEEEFDILDFRFQI